MLLKLLTSVVIVLITVCTLRVDAAAEPITISGNYSCDNTTIYRQGNKVSLKKAKAKISAQIKNIRAKLKATKSNSKKNALKEQIRQLNALASVLNKCAQGQLTSTLATFERLSGSQLGNWNNSTFGTSGPITTALTLTDGILSGTITIGGSLFGALAAEPIQIQQNIKGTTLPYVVTLTDTSIGDLEITFITATTFQARLTGIPVPGIAEATFNGQINDNWITGTFESRLVGGIKLAEGTVALNRM